MAASSTPSSIGIRTSRQRGSPARSCTAALMPRPDRAAAAAPARRRRGCRARCCPTCPITVGAASMELSTASSLASTTAAKSGSMRTPRHDGCRRQPVVATDLDPGRRRHEDLAAAVVGHRSGAGEPEADPPGQPRTPRSVHRRIGDDEPDTGTGGGLAVGCPRRARRPGRAGARPERRRRSAGHESRSSSSAGRRRCGRPR